MAHQIKIYHGEMKIKITMTQIILLLLQNIFPIGLIFALLLVSSLVHIFQIFTDNNPKTRYNFGCFQLEAVCQNIQL
jgi:hypothetical protein